MRWMDGIGWDDGGEGADWDKRIQGPPKADRPHHGRPQARFDPFQGQVGGLGRAHCGNGAWDSQSILLASWDVV